MKVSAVICALALSAGTFASSAHADEFLTSLDAARKAYEKGDVNAVREELDYARQLLGQMRASNLEDLLPAARDGWERQKAESNSQAGMAMFGGGTTTEARYTRDGDRVTIGIVADSPLIASMSMIFSNPALAGANGQMKRIKGQKALIKEDGEITTLVDGRILVTVSGNASAEDMQAWFEAIEFDKLKGF